MLRAALILAALLATTPALATESTEADHIVIEMEQKRAERRAALDRARLVRDKRIESIARAHRTSVKLAPVWLKPIVKRPVLTFAPPLLKATFSTIAAPCPRTKTAADRPSRPDPT